MVADYDDPAKMPAFGIASADIANNNNGSISTYGDLKNIDTTGTNESETWAVGDELFVNNNKLTNIRPSSETQEVQKIAKIIRVHANNGQMFLMGAGRSNDVPNLDTNHVFIGNAGGVEKRLLTSADVTNSAGYITASSSDTLTNKSGSNSQWTNDEAYIKADSTDTLTNKSGNISQWTNDAGYLTSETDNQTLSFANPNLSISNGNSVDLSALTPSTLAWSAITGTPTTLSGYGITDGYTDADVDSHLNRNLANPDELLMWDGADWAWFKHQVTVATSNNYNDLDNLPTLTTINNNADNRIITGSGTADTLEGEADFTWDGSNAVIDGSSAGLTNPILHLKTDNSQWNRPQLMCTDSNGDVFSQVGQLNTTWGNFYQWNITLDPNNTHGRTGVTTQAGEYYVSFEKNFSDQADISMDMTVYGAHKGFNITVRDDGNSYGGNQYKGRPLNLNALETNFNCGEDRNVLALTVQENKIDCKVPIGQARLSSDPANPAGGWTYYNTTTNKLRLYVDGGTPGWVDLN